jgi:hypothetical protein
MHLYFINLFQLNYSLRVSNKEVRHQEFTSVLATYSISHASMGCPAANTIRFPWDKGATCWSFSSMYHDARFRECKIITVYYHINLQLSFDVTIPTSLSLDISILFIWGKSFLCRKLGSEKRWIKRQNISSWHTVTFRTTPADYMI